MLHFVKTIVYYDASIAEGLKKRWIRLFPGSQKFFKQFEGFSFTTYRGFQGRHSKGFRRIGEEK